jgi:hypothetical protein
LRIGEIRESVVGFGFNSNGRYAPSGLLRDRFIPRLEAAKVQAILNDAGDNFEPAHVLDVLMRNEKPGGHGERSVAVGFLDMGCGTPSQKSQEFRCTGFSLNASAGELRTQKFSPMPPAATTIPGKTCPLFKGKCRVTSILATPS